MKQPMWLWEFDNAPEKFKALAPNDDDRDWLLFVPAGVDAPPFLDGSWFGVCGVTEHDVSHDTMPGKVYIGSHA